MATASGLMQPTSLETALTCDEDDVRVAFEALLTSLEVDETTNYEEPELFIDGGDEGVWEEEIAWWVIFVGFSYAAALAYAAYCTSRGGSADISLTWKGFKVACYR